MPYDQNFIIKKNWRLMNGFSFVFLLGLALFLTGCTPYSIIIPGHLEDQVNYQLRFEDIENRPESFKGELIIVGGEVLAIDGGQDEERLLIRQHPLSRNLTPQQQQLTSGKYFMAV